MKQFILLFVVAMQQLMPAQAQPEKACQKVDKILAAIHLKQEDSGLLGEFDYEDAEYDAYKCTISLNPDMQGYIYTAAEEKIPVSYDEWVCDYSTKTDAENVYFDYVTALKRCLGDKLIEEVNPDAKAGQIHKVAFLQVSPTLVFKLFLKEEIYDEMSMHSFGKMEFYVLAYIGEP